MVDFTKDKRVVILCKRSNTTPVRIKKIKVKLEEEDFKYKEKTFPINTKLPAFKDGNINYYFVDMETNIQLLLGRSDDKVKLDAETIDLIIGKSIVKQVLTTFQSFFNNPQTILVLILTVAVGLLGGFLLGQLVSL